MRVFSEQVHTFDQAERSGKSRSDAIQDAKDAMPAEPAHVPYNMRTAGREVLGINTTQLIFSEEIESSSHPLGKRRKCKKNRTLYFNLEIENILQSAFSFSNTTNYNLYTV
jgi:hypothetical protein